MESKEHKYTGCVAYTEKKEVQEHHPQVASAFLDHDEDREDCAGHWETRRKS